MDTWLAYGTGIFRVHTICRPQHDNLGFTTIRKDMVFNRQAQPLSEVSLMSRGALTKTPKAATEKSEHNSSSVHKYFTTDTLVNKI